VSLRAEFDDAGHCRVFATTGYLLRDFGTAYVPAFNRQYPPPFSPDQRVLYVGNWERGLFCYDVDSCQLAWRKGPGKVRHIFPFEGGATVEMAGRGLFRRAQESGELTGAIKMSGIEVALRLGRDTVFTGPFRRDYFVYDLVSLKPLARIAEAELNPDRCLSFVIREVFELEGQLVVRGFEEYPYGDYAHEGQRGCQRRVRAT
jgi:hypothetical protein